MVVLAARRPAQPALGGPLPHCRTGGLRDVTGVAEARMVTSHVPVDIGIASLVGRGCVIAACDEDTLENRCPNFGVVVLL